MQNKFSKFIKVLLGILAVLCIALVIVVIVHIKSNLPLDTITDQDYDELAKQVQQKQAEGLEKNNSDEVKSETYLYKNHGFEIELPKGFIPNETESEGGPYISMNLPDFGQLVYVTNVSFVKNLGGYCAAFAGQGTYVGKEKFGTNSFDHWSCTNGNITVETYVFEQGNIAYVFMPDNGPITESFRNVMETFKYIGFK